MSSTLVPFPKIIGRHLRTSGFYFLGNNRCAASALRLGVNAVLIPWLRQWLPPCCLHPQVLRVPPPFLLGCLFFDILMKMLKLFTVT